MRAVPPYSLPTAEFSFRALVRTASKAALGGAREQVFALLLAARLVEGAVGEHRVASPLRRTRASAAKSWLSALALPATSRTVMSRLMEATASDDWRALADAWEAAQSVVAPVLDPPAMAELRRLTHAVNAAAS